MDSRWIADNIIDLAKIVAAVEERQTNTEKRLDDRDDADKKRTEQRPAVWQVWLAAIALVVSIVSTGTTIYFATHPTIIRVPTYTPPASHR